MLQRRTQLLWSEVTLEPALNDRKRPGFRQVSNWVKQRAPVCTSNCIASNAFHGGKWSTHV